MASVLRIDSVAPARLLSLPDLCRDVIQTSNGVNVRVDLDFGRARQFWENWETNVLSKDD